MMKVISTVSLLLLFATDAIGQTGRASAPAEPSDTVASESPEAVVQRQLDAYNARDIEAFLSTYSDTIVIYDFPHQPTMRGPEEVRTRYTQLFKDAPDLHAEVKKRITIGNTVIDQEHVRVGGRYIEAVAIYEVADGKIGRVTFVRDR